MVELDERVGGPEFLTQFLASDQLAWAADQDGKHLKRLGFELDRPSATAQPGGGEVEFEDAEAKRRRT